MRAIILIPLVFSLSSAAIYVLSALYDYHSTKSRFVKGAQVIVWKKCKLNNGIIVHVKLVVPKEAKRTLYGYMEGRIEYGKVLKITDCYDNQYNECISIDPRKPTVYKVGETVYPDSYNGDKYNTATNGIHVVLDEEEI